MRTTVVLGAGASGRELHAAPLARLHPTRSIVWVDPAPPPDLACYPDLDALGQVVDVRAAVVHVCTPADQHVSLVVDLVERGVRRIVLEKPIARDEAALEVLTGCLTAHPDLRLVPVAVWPHAHAVDELRLLVAGRATGERVHLEMVQSKDRAADGARARGGSLDAFDIELPHMMLLARHLLGPIVDVELSTSRPAPWAPDEPASGGATVRVRHAGGDSSTLHSDLTAPSRERHVTVSVEGRWCRVDLPPDRYHPWSMTTSPGRDRIRRHEDPLGRFLSEAYHLLDGEAARPRRTVPLGEHLDAARACLRARSTARDDVRTNA